MKDVNLETITETLSWYKIWQLCGFNHACEQQKLLRKQKRAYKNPWSRRGNRKSLTLTIHWNLAKPVKTYPGIIVRRHHTVQRQMVLLKERYAELQEGTSAVLLQSGLDEKWWADSMECYCSLRNIQDLLFDGKIPYERRFGEPLTGSIIPFGSMVECHPRLHQFGKKVIPGIFLGYVLCAGRIWKGDFLVAENEDLEKWAHQKSVQGDSMQRKCWRPKMVKKCPFQIADGKVKLSGGDHVLRTSTLIRDGPDRGEEQRNLQGESDEPTSRLIAG